MAIPLNSASLLPNVFVMPVILLNKTCVAEFFKEVLPSYRTLKIKPIHQSQMKNYKYPEYVERCQGKRGPHMRDRRAAVKPLIG